MICFFEFKFRFSVCVNPHNKKVYSTTKEESLQLFNLVVTICTIQDLSFSESHLPTYLILCGFYARA